MLKITRTRFFTYHFYYKKLLNRIKCKYNFFFDHFYSFYHYLITSLTTLVNVLLIICIIKKKSGIMKFTYNFLLISLLLKML